MRVIARTGLDTNRLRTPICEQPPHKQHDSTEREEEEKVGDLRRHCVKDRDAEGMWIKERFTSMEKGREFGRRNV